MTAERKYTDRDVREDSTLKLLAEEYIQNYGGDFEPLVNAVAIYRDTGDLPVSIVRVVLNCMRYDRNVAPHLPNPKKYEMGAVVEIERHRKKRKNYYQDCDNFESHYGHSWQGEENDTYWCSGVPFLINRETFSTCATVKFPLAKARHGKLVHHITGEAWIYWLPPSHTYGPARAIELQVKSLCKYPSVIVRPQLLSAEKATSLISLNPADLALCPYCQAVINSMEVRKCQQQLR